MILRPALNATVMSFIEENESNEKSVRIGSFQNGKKNNDQVWAKKKDMVW